MFKEYIISMQKWGLIGMQWDLSKNASVWQGCSLSDFHSIPKVDGTPFFLHVYTNIVGHQISEAQNNIPL